MPEEGPAYRRAVGAVAATARDARTLWRDLGRGGLLNPLLAVTGQSCQVDAERLRDLLAELDAHLPVGLVLSVCVQAASAIPLLAAAARDSEPAGQVLSQALRGEAIIALSATDADLSGSALLDTRTEVDRSGDEILLRGGKDWICNAETCDYMLVLARHRPARHFTSFCWVLLPAGSPGVSCRPAASELFAGAGLGHLRFDDVRLTPEQLVGRPGRALAEFAVQIATERLASALWARAMCRRVLTGTREHLRTRSTGGGTLWDNAAVREHFARCLVELRRIDALCAAHLADLPAAAQGMALKVACAESADRILAECVSLHGAAAFRDGGVASLREQAAMFGIAGGATGAMLAGVADHADELLRAAE